MAIDPPAHVSKVLTVVAGVRPQSSRTMSGSCNTGPRWSPKLPAAVFLADSKSMSTCRYINSLLDGMTVKPPDVRYTHLADEEAARRYAKLLIHELAPSGFYSSRSCFLEVKDETGSLLFSIPFREIAADK